MPKEPLWRILNVARGRYWSELGNTPGHLQHWSRPRLHSRCSRQRFEVIEVRNPLPWTMALCRARERGDRAAPARRPHRPLIGWAAVAASLGFVGLQLWQHAPWRLAGAHLEALTAAIVGGALLYGLAGFLLSSAWYQLLGAGSRDGVAPLPPRRLRPHPDRQVSAGQRAFIWSAARSWAAGSATARGAWRSPRCSRPLLLVLVAAALSLPLVWHWLDQGLLWIGALAAPRCLC